MFYYTISKQIDHNPRSKTLEIFYPNNTSIVVKNLVKKEYVKILDTTIITLSNT